MLRFIYVHTLDVHNGRYFIKISLIFCMQTILLMINSCTKFKNQSTKARHSGTSKLQKINKLSIFGHFDDF